MLPNRALRSRYGPCGHLGYSPNLCWRDSKGAFSAGRAVSAETKQLLPLIESSGPFQAVVLTPAFFQSRDGGFVGLSGGSVAVKQLRGCLAGRARMGHNNTS